MITKVPNQNGFTLVELMIVMVILGIIFSTALPSLSAFVDRTAVDNVNRQLLLDLVYAKSEAVSRRVQVQVVPAVGNDWDSGWRVIEVDNLGAEVRQIREHPAIPANASITSVEFAAGAVVEFQSTGRATLPGDFHVQLDSCVAPTEEAFQISITLVGRTVSGGTQCNP